MHVTRWNTVTVFLRSGTNNREVEGLSGTRDKAGTIPLILGHLEPMNDVNANKSMVE